MARCGNEDCPREDKHVSERGHPELVPNPHRLTEAELAALG